MLLLSRLRLILTRRQRSRRCWLLSLNHLESPEQRREIDHFIRR
jgi:hypothetical protein